MWYTDKISKHKWASAYYVEDDERISVSECYVQVKMATALYPMKTSRKGFTYDKKTKKIKTWYGTELKTLQHLNTVLKELGFEWVINESFDKWLTKGFLEKILSKKITNPKEACKHLISSLRLKPLSPESLRQYIKNGGNKVNILSVKDAINDIEGYARTVGFIDQTRFDIVKQAKALGRKFDWNWSERRLNDLHTEWTRELMRAELDMLEDEQVDWSGLVLPSGFEAITSRKQLFEEGAVMKHCVYTNYWHRVQSKNYLALRATDSTGKIATVGLHLHPLRLDQIKSTYNSEPSGEIKQMVQSLLQNEEFKESLKDEEAEDLKFEHIPF